MNTKPFRTLMLCGVAILAAGCTSTVVTDAVVKPTISAATPKHLSAAEDPFNAAMLSNLAPGLITVVRVTPAKIELVQAYIMLTPNFTRHLAGRGDRIVATLSAGGAKVSETEVSDPSVAIEENLDARAPAKGRVVHMDERSIALSLPMPHRVDALDVSVSATGQTARFDVSRLVGAYCAKEPKAPACLAAGAAPSSR